LDPITDFDNTMSRADRPIRVDRRATEERRQSTARVFTGSILVIAILYFAKPVVLPVALAILLAFVLRPIVSLLEKTFLRRSGAIALTLAVVLTLTVLAGWALVVQINSLAKEISLYSGTLERKLRVVNVGSSQSFALMESTLQRLAQTGEAQETADMKVRVIPEREGISERFRRFLPTFEIVAAFFLIVVFVFFLLKDREQFRDKLLRLSGRAHLTVTTQAIGETLHRISRYLLTTAVLNASFGILIGLGLFLLGLPHAFLWGVIAALARFIPYVGAIVSAALPTLLALAYYPDWFHPLAVLALFLILDQIIGGFIEPLVIGHRVGVSPIMILLATIFWGWLWGPVGMLLATPITVSLTVAGEFIPALRVFSIIFGTEAALEDYLGFYNRLIVRDRASAIALADRYAETNSMELAFTDLFIPTLTFAAEERERRRITSVHDHFIKDVIRELIIRQGDVNAQIGEDSQRLIAVSVGGERLSLGTLMLTQLLRVEGFVVDAFTDLPESDLIVYINEVAPEAVFVSCSNPLNVEVGHSLLQRLAQLYPHLIILGGGSAFGRTSEKTKASGATIVPTSLIEVKDAFLRERRQRLRSGMSRQAV